MNEEQRLRKILEIESLIMDPYQLPRQKAKPPSSLASYTGYTNSRITDKPGVYFIFNNKNQIIYVGNSKNIRKRIACHLNPRSSQMYPHIDALNYTVSYILIDHKALRFILESVYQYIYHPRYNDTKYQPKRYQKWQKIKLHNGREEYLTINEFYQIYDTPAKRAAIQAIKEVSVEWGAEWPREIGRRYDKMLKAEIEGEPYLENKRKLIELEWRKIISRLGPKPNLYHSDKSNPSAQTTA